MLGHRLELRALAREHARTRSRVGSALQVHRQFSAIVGALLEVHQFAATGLFYLVWRAIRSWLRFGSPHGDPVQLLGSYVLQVSFCREPSGHDLSRHRPFSFSVARSSVSGTLASSGSISALRAEPVASKSNANVTSTQQDRSICCSCTPRASPSCGSDIGHSSTHGKRSSC